MEKEKSPRKKSTDKYSMPAADVNALPEPPPDPRLPEMPEAFRRIAGFQRRQDTFLQTLATTISAEESGKGAPTDDSDCGGGGVVAAAGIVDDDGSSAAGLTAECDEFIKPLLTRTGPSISAALVTEGAIDQLNKLHGILEQLLDMQAQNYRLQRSTRDVETLIALKQSQMRVSIVAFFFE